MEVHIQLDDTRILKRIEYDPVLDRFVGFCLPIKDGLPDANTFVFRTFQKSRLHIRKSLPALMPTALLPSQSCLKHQHLCYLFWGQIQNTHTAILGKDGST